MRKLSPQVPYIQKLNNLACSNSSSSTLSRTPSSTPSRRCSVSSLSQTIAKVNPSLQKLNIETPPPAADNRRVYIATDLEASTEDFKCYDTGTPTQLGLAILRATDESAKAFTKDPFNRQVLKKSAKFHHFRIEEFLKYRPRIRKLAKCNGEFLFGKSEVIPLDQLNKRLECILEEESRYGKITLVGHAISNDIQFLKNGEIDALSSLYGNALDVQRMLIDRYGRSKNLGDLVQDFDGSIRGWHNAGNDAVWTLWVLMKRLLQGKDEKDEEPVPVVPVSIGLAQAIHCKTI